MACQKMANGFATTEELAGKAGVLVSHEGMMGPCWDPLRSVPLPADGEGSDGFPTQQF